MICLLSRRAGSAVGQESMALCLGAGSTETSDGRRGRWRAMKLPLMLWEVLWRSLPLVVDCSETGIGWRLGGLGCATEAEGCRSPLKIDDREGLVSGGYSRMWCSRSCREQFILTWEAVSEAWPQCGPKAGCSPNLA